MKTLSKYLAFARLGARQVLRERGDLYGRVAFFTVILGVFSALWRAVEELPLADADGLIWYLAATEWIVLSAPHLWTDVQEEVRRGDVAVQAGRPVSYVGATLARGMGALFVRATVLAPVACAAAFAFSGTVPNVEALLGTAALGLLGSALLTWFYLILGVGAFWLKDVSPLFWLWQKALFVLGGLSLPIGFYPEWLQFAARLTPFPWLLGFPAGLLLDESPAGVAFILLQLLGWATFASSVVLWLFRRALTSLALEGG